MELDQWWRLRHRTGHRRIEKCNMNVLTAMRERALSWAGHVARLDYKEICALHWKEAEKDKSSAPKTIQNLQMRGHAVGRGLQVCWKRRWLCGICSSVHGLGATCSRSWALETVFKILERVLPWCCQCGYAAEVHQMPRGPMCARHDGGTLPVDGIDWC